MLLDTLTEVAYGGKQSTIHGRKGEQRQVKIIAVETILFEPAWDDPFAARHRRTHAAIRVLTDQGLVGNSRTWGPGVKTIEDYLAPALVGEDPRNVERLWEKMARVAREAN